MAEVNKTTNKQAAGPVKKSPHRRKPRPFKKGGKRMERPKDDFEQKIVDLTRVTRVMAGGKRMKFRVCMVVGDKKGKVGIGIAKGIDVAMAVQKAVTQAKKNIIEVPIVDGTIPHQINIKYGSAKLMMKPGKAGSGIKAGGVMRIVLELAGVKDIVAKILGTNNKVNNAKACSLALQAFLPAAKTTAKHQAPAHKKLEEKK
jgi:small subunit ribosomal protein S5